MDHFADADLALACPVRRAPRYPHDLNELLREAPSAPWLYTGALENHPEIVDRLAAKRPLWGNDAKTLRTIRDPIQLASALQRAGFLALRGAPSHEGLPTDGSWLVKRRRSAGGFHVRRWNGELRRERPETHYFQEYIEGIPCSAVFVAAAGKAALLGATRQLIGESWSGASGFQYAGSIGPLALETREEAELRRLGTTLSAEFGLRGLFGVDFVINAEGLWPIEVNPRYTASVEILERAMGLRAIQRHAAACRDLTLPKCDDLPRAGTRQHGKAILFAPSGAQLSAALSDRLLAWNRERSWPELADIPAAGSLLELGAPVATVFASGATDAETVAALRERTASLRRLLFPDCAGGIE